MSKLKTPHDRFFKAAWSRLEVARGFLARYLPAEVHAALDLSTLELTKDSFIDAVLTPHYSDLLYRVTTSDGKPAYVYILLEHKSYPDPLITFQLLRYMIRIWEKELQNSKAHQLPAIVPMVLYHGNRAWRQGTDKLDETILREALHKALPDMGETLMPTLAETWIEQGIQKGLQQGMQKGVEQGLEKGLQQGELLTLKRLLVKRFGPLPEAAEQRLVNASRAELETWLDQVLDAPSLEMLFRSG